MARVSSGDAFRGGWKTLLPVCLWALGLNAAAQDASPTLTSISPVAGPAIGGTAVQLSGSNFQSGALVMFGGNPAGNVVVADAGTITASTPAGAPGAVDVTVINPDGQAATLSGGYTYNPPPSLTSVSPAAGPTAGGTALTLSGTNFLTGVTVAFGDNPATNVVVVNATTITATTPPGTAGTTNVTVTNPDGQSATLNNAYTYNPPPSVVSVSPAYGPLGGGTAVTLTGANFVSGATVAFGANPATNVVVASASTITTTAPSGAAGAVSVTVTNPDGQSGTLANGYTYNPPPTLTSISPVTGATNGGTAVTLSGSNFMSGATVSFGSTPAANVVVVNSTTITATTPAASAGTVNVTVTNPDGQSATLYGLAQPLTNPDFESGTAGWMFSGTGSATVVTNPAQAHSGNNFVQLNSASGQHPMYNSILASGNSTYLPVNPGDVITFGGWAARVSGDGRARWTLVVVDANQANPIYVATANVTSSSWSYAQNSYTIPSSGRYVRFECEITGNTVAATANFDDAILVRAILGGGFTFLNGVGLGWIGPSSGPANFANPVSITGTNFASGASVTFAGVPATNVSVLNATQITATTPALPPGPAPVVVTNPGGQASTPVLNYVFNAPPSVSSVTPAVGSLAGGTGITVAGAGFLPGGKVTVGGVAARNVVVTANAINAATPPHAAGTVDVVVTNPDSQYATASGAFTYVQPPPSVAAVSPVSGSTKGGTVVIISGANFLPGPNVTFGGVAAAVTAASAASITVLTPAGSAGAADVTVTNSDAQAGTLGAGFNYVSPGPAPTLTSINAPSGSTAGGATITLTGTNFVSGATVALGGVSATNVSVISSSTIMATTPAHSPGMVNVTVTNPDGQSATLLGVISLLPNPSFESGAADWQFTGSGNAGVLNDPSNTEDGNRYLLLTANAGGPAKYFATDSSGINEYFPVTPGDVITFGGGAYRLSGDGNARYMLAATDIHKSVLVVVYTTPPNVTVPVWGNLLGTYTVPAGVAFVKFAAVISSNTVTAQVRFDETVLQRTPAGTGYNYTGLSSPGIYTYHYDSFLTGQNTSESTLTPANVNKTLFGKKFSYPVDGWIHAQPLYVANVVIGGTAHNVVYVATEHDSVYAFDADGLQTAPLWQTSFINPSAGITTVPSGDLGIGEHQPEFGILATPVIDPVAGTVFVLARTKENGAYFQRLHALDITTGFERSGSPVVIQVSVTGTGMGAVGSQLSYDPLRQNARPGMVLSNGIVYFGAASIQDTDPYHGWVIGYDSQTLTLAGVYNSTPYGTRGGTWQSGSGIAADSLGSLYFETGNGTFDANVGGQDYGDSILKVQQTASGLNLVDFFTPYNQAALSAADLDLASGGVMLLPDQPGPHPHELIGGGKQGTLYVVDRDAMGGFNPSGDTQIVQALPGALPSTTKTVLAGLWSTPTYWSNRVYFTGRHDVIKMFMLQNGLLVGPVSQGKFVMSFMSSVVSSNGAYNGILWVLQNDAGNTLHAFDPDDLTREYYNTNQAGTRDVPGGTTKFSVPLVVNGNVYLGTKTEVDVYGLLN